MQRGHFLPIVRHLYAVNGCSRFNELCREYGIVDMCRSVFRKRVWDVFISSVVFRLLYIFPFISSLSTTLYCVI